MRIFYVLHIREKAIADCVDAIRFICNPAEKQSAHLTVRGPYQKRIGIKSINKRIIGDTVLIDRTGNFFDTGQNTVFFHCTASALKNVWNKPDYPFNPHITIYDGSSKEFAQKLYAVISRFNYRLKFQAEGLEAIESRKGQQSMCLALAFNTKSLRHVLREKIEPDAISGFSDDRRLQLVEKLCQHLSRLPARTRSVRAYQHTLPYGAPSD
jgi:hypothetical protein